MVSDLGILQILGWPVFHAEQDGLQEIEAENSEPLEEQSFPLLGEAEGTDESQGWMDVLDEGVRMALCKIHETCYKQEKKIYHFFWKKLSGSGSASIWLS